MPPTLGWRSFEQTDTQPGDANPLSSNSLDDQTARFTEEQNLESEEGETRAGATAPDMLAAFASVGAERFDLTLTDAHGGKVGFRGNPTLEQLRSAMPTILQEAAERQHNVIVRPRCAGATLIQLDDLGEDAAARLFPMSFLVLRTSPGNYQAWIAVADADEDFARNLKKGTGADLAASGASRVSGSINFKEKYAPAFPRVKTVHASFGKIVTRAEVEALGVVAPEGHPRQRQHQLQGKVRTGFPARRDGPCQLWQGSDASRSRDPRRCSATGRTNPRWDTQPSQWPQRLAELPALRGEGAAGTQR
jgi:hypothetical protein